VKNDLPIAGNMKYIFKMLIRRLHDTAAIIILSLVPRSVKALSSTITCKTLSEQNQPANMTQVSCILAPIFSVPGYSATAEGTRRLFFPYGMPIAAPFILFRLKRSGFSDCRVTVTDGGLLVTARR
jgi:hypothetical protein